MLDLTDLHLLHEMVNDRIAAMRSGEISGTPYSAEDLEDLAATLRTMADPHN